MKSLLIFIIFLLSPSQFFVSASSIKTVECDTYGPEIFRYECHNSSSCIVLDLTLNKNDTVLFTNTDDLQNTHIEFDDSEIHKFPKEIFKQFDSLQIVTLRKCKVQEIEDLSFEDAKDLLSLDLGENKLQTITDKTFIGAVNLKYLDLEANDIANLSKLSFHFLPNLQVLQLSDNYIKEISMELLAPLKNLQSFNFYSTKDVLTNIHPKSFLNNNKLSRLVLQVYNFTEITLEFQSTNLHSLVLHGSGVKSVVIKNTNNATIRICNIHGKVSHFWIDPSFKVRQLFLHRSNTDPFSNISSLSLLTELHLQRNEIEKIEINVLNNFQNLKILDLESNKITTIEDGSFIKLKNLQRLSLDQNPLKTFNISVLHGLKNLTQLGLSYAKLKELDYEGLVKEHPSLDKLVISGNDFNCSFVENMVNYIKEHTKILIMRSMRHYGFVDVSDLDDLMSYCDKTDPDELTYTKGTGMGLIVTIFVMTVLASMVGFYVYKRELHKRFILRPNEFSNPLTVAEEA